MNSTHSLIPLAALIAAFSSPAGAATRSPGAVEHELVAPSALPALDDLTLLLPPLNQVSKEGDTVSVGFAATHATDVTYEALDLPPGLSLDAATGVVAGTVAPLSAGDYAVTIRANGPARWENVTIYWTILDVTAPQLASPGVQVSTAGSSAQLQLVATDARTDKLTFSAMGLPTGLAIDATTGTISGTIADSSLRTTYYVTLTVSDGNVLGGTVFTWIVLPNG